MPGGGGGDGGRGGRGAMGDMRGGMGGMGPGGGMGLGGAGLGMGMGGGMGALGMGGGGITPEVLAQLGLEGPISNTVFVANVSALGGMSVCLFSFFFHAFLNRDEILQAEKNETPQLLMFCMVKAQIRYKSVAMTDWKKKFV